MGAEVVSRWLRPAALAILMSALAGCATPTGYTKADPVWSPRYGYRDKRIDGSEFSIVVNGNPHTSRERAAQIALLRAAYLTREEGARYFAILKDRKLSMKSSQLIAVPFVAGGAVGLVPVVEQTTREPTALLLIRVLPSGAPPAAEAIDAEELIQRLGQQFR